MIKKKQKTESSAIIYVQCSSNNTIVSLTKPCGTIITTLSSGHLKYKNSRKGTQIASQQVIFYLGQKALGFGYSRFVLKVKGVGKGRNSLVKELKKAGVELTKIIDVTPVPYNGCRVAKGKK